MSLTYSRQLECATRAAVLAGGILRSEFHRPGGPRGTTDHAEADPIAEKLIHEILTDAFPEYGYLGEELGSDRTARDPDTHLWLVDPNDGTAAYMKGFRGASVSIALLRKGQPVLGVVYAYSAPDDAGDLFTWAEGTGPLRRNGNEITRVWPSKPSAESTVLVAQHGDKKALANAQVVAPMRFRPVPSIAYRLALVAAGEADATVSLSWAGGWDYAAGHALLIGAGGGLYDRHAESTRYALNGESDCGGRCLAGPLPLVNYLAGRDWDTFLRSPSGRKNPDPLCWPVRGRAIPDTGLLSRAQGCLLGQFAGDALGSLVEFKTPAEIARRYPKGVRSLADGGTWSHIAGQPTDDSEMALALARALVQAGGFDAECVARAYGRWYLSGPFDIGGTTAAALGPGARALEAGHSAGMACRRSANPESQANGSLMRISPLGVFGASLPDTTLVELARADAALTHPHRICRDAASLFAAAIAYAIRSGPQPSAVHEYVLQLAGKIGADTALVDALENAADRPPVDFIKNQGWVLIAFQNAFYQMLRAPDLETGVVDTVMRGGDTDTNAAIAGALLGAVHGREAVPLQWRDRVLTCRPLDSLDGVRHPRPKAYWPVDALWLAEGLLLAGEAAAKQ